MQGRYRGDNLGQQRRGETGETLGERHRLELPHQHALGGCLERLAPVLLRVEQTVDARVRVSVLNQPLFTLGLQLEHLVLLGQHEERRGGLRGHELRVGRVAVLEEEVELGGALAW